MKKDKLVEMAKKVPLEAWVWTFGLAVLAIVPVEAHRLTFCPIELLGFEHCPGKGLGKSVAYLLHGEVVKSVQAHYLGAFALAMLAYRIVSLSIRAFRQQ